MSQPKALLETFVMGVSAVLKERFPSIKKTTITVTKVHPPIVQYTGSVSVRFSKEF
jgi:dihydroneopterin aldolase